MNNSNQKVFAVCNSAAGQANVDQIHSALQSHFAEPEWTLEIYQATGKEDLAAISRDACKRGAALVIAAGGDGTVVGVANGLVKSQVPLGILPMGTGNGLARALNIPLELEKAVELLAGKPTLLQIDALQVGERYFFSNVSVGISPRLMKETTSTQKRRFGVLAYIWTMLKCSSIFQLHHYTVTIDDRPPQRVRAAEILISNIRLLDKPLRVFDSAETICDGQLNAYLVTARNFREYVRLIWSLFRHPGQSAPRLYHLFAQKSIRIETNPHPRLVQADGEVIGHTPVEVKLLPKAINIIVPAALTLEPQ